MRCKQDMIDAGEKVLPRTCPVHGIHRCRPIASKIAPKMTLMQIATALPRGTRVYVAGPMTGVVDLNFPAFHEAAGALRQLGCEVFNPADTAGPKTYREYLTIDLDWICRQADAIALLPGWQNSKGARAERATAEALGLQIVEL